MGGQAMKFDSRSRLWIGTRHDHSDYSYIDVWTGTEYSGSVRVHDRLIGFDILGSTLVTVVRRPPDRRGILGQAIPQPRSNGLASLSQRFSANWPKASSI